MPLLSVPADACKQTQPTSVPLILDPPDREYFDSFADLTAAVFNAPVAAVSLVASGRVWFVAQHGEAGPPVDFRSALFRHAFESDELLVVEDLCTDPRFSDGPPVAQDGLRFYAGVPLRTRSGEPLGVLCVCGFQPRSFSRAEAAQLGRLATVLSRELHARSALHDLSKRAERLGGLLNSEQRYRRLFDLMLNGVALKEIICDPDGQPYDCRILEVNSAFEELTGRPAAEMVGKTEREVFPELARDWIHAFGQAALMGKAVRFEIYHEPVDRHLEVLAFQTEPYHFATIISDISDRRRAVKQLREHASALKAANYELKAQKQELRVRRMQLEVINEHLQRARDAAEDASRSKSEFLANMSHEIRTPMTAILGYADLLREPGLSQRERDEHLDTVCRNGEHLLSILNDILDISKIEAGKLALERVDCSLLSVLSDVVSLMRVRANGKGLSLHVQYEFPLPAKIRSDAVRLRQILVNLVGNAIKFTTQGEVRIIAALDHRDAGRPRIRIEVTDTGIGISSEQLGCLFRPFSQADASTSRHFGGTGLGLTISKRLSQALGGDIQVRSRVGRGSSFIVTIDPGPLDRVRMLHDATEAVSADPQTVDRPATTQLNGRILLAEDGPDNQRLITAILRKAGLEVELADNGRIACERVAQARAAGRPYDLVLMDMQMPEMDGYAATRKLRRKGHALPIIALTAHAMSGDREKCLRTGCNDYVPKPVDRRQLIATIRSCLARREDPSAAR